MYESYQNLKTWLNSWYILYYSIISEDENTIIYLVSHLNVKKLR